MMKIKLNAASVRVEMDYFRSGSVLRGDMTSGCREVRTFFEIESDAPEDELRQLVRNAKGGCFAENMVQTAVSLKSIITVNGEKLEPSELK